MHGVQPKAKAKPIRKPLQMPGFAAVLRKCTSRFSQRASTGPKNPITLKREKVHRAKIEKERSVVQQADDAEGHEHHTEDYSDARRQLDEQTDQVQAEEHDKRAGDGRQKIAILP